MHLNRWITSIVALPMLGVLILKGGSIAFAILIGIAAILSLWEYFRIVMVPLGREVLGSIEVLGYIISPLMIWAAYKKEWELILGLLMLNLLLSGLMALPQFKTDSKILTAVSKQVAGLIYIPLSLSFLVMIRNTDSGIIWIVLLLCIIFAGDTAAYYVGSYFGRHKLCPSVSPGKTIEGSIGGLAGNLIIGALVKYLYFPQLPWSGCFLLFISLGAAGQIGDLFESGLKRSAGVKDSGIILPGHGGVLDRIDALLFSAPLAYLFKVYFF